jgi:hypothetical protein
VARGWESKSVEEQIREREGQAQITENKKRTRRDSEQNSKKAGILLARSRTVTAMEGARDERYRALLQRTLDHLDSELKKLA